MASVKPSKKRLLGIDIGGSGVKGAPVHTKKGHLLTDRERIPTPQPATPEAVAETVAAIYEHFDWSGPIGCTIPARVQNGITETAANIDDSWIGTDVEQLFEEAIGSHAVVLNDADAAGLAEITFGRGRNEPGTVLVLTFGTGIGSALFRDGELVPNTELGHLRWDADHVLEDRAADSARTRDDLSWEEWATERVQPTLEHLEFVFSPDLIIVGGGASRPHKWEEYSPHLTTKARLKPAKLENEAGLIGAALAARHWLKKQR